MTKTSHTSAASRPQLSVSKQTDDRTDYASEDNLWDTERCLQRYNACVVSMLSKQSRDAADVLDFGAGIGTLSELWWRSTGVRPECLEIDASLRGVLQSRGFVTHESLASLEKKYDTIFTSNVLEHIEDDVKTLGLIRSHLKPEGLVAIYVPAFMCLYSQHDSAVGHYRRYNRRELVEKVRSVGLQVVRCHYVDSVGFLAWMLLKFRSSGADPTAGLDGSLSFYDKYIFPISRGMDAIGLRNAVGKNLFLLAKNVG